MDNKKIKIIYDISPLGTHGYMRGIPRVVEEMAIGLCRRPECEVIFCSDKESYPYVKKYLKRVNYFPGCRLSKPDAFANLSLFVSWMEYSSIRRSELKATIKEGARYRQALRIYKEFLRYTWKVTSSFIISDISRKDLETADVYHEANLNFPARVRRYSNISVFHTVHDIIPILYPQYFPKNVTRLMKRYIERLSKTDFLLCVSHSTRNDLLNYSNKFDPKRVFVIHLAASNKFHPCESSEEVEAVRRKYKIPEKYILSVAAFDTRKNLHLLIRSFANLVISEKIKDLSLVLTGPLGWLYEKIFQAIADNPEVKDRIIITGYVDDEDLSPLYTGALTFVFLSAYEGFGLPPLEAMQCGAPVITSNTSSLPEVVGDAGIMVSPNDTEELSEAIYRVYKSEALRKDMSTRSLERAKLFSWEKCVDQTVAAYKKAMAMR